MSGRSVTIYAMLALSTIAAGAMVRFAPLGLPPFVSKYGGSMLWALAIYWISAALPPGRPPLVAGMMAGLITSAVELFKLYHAPSVDAFRNTLPGALLLGRMFSLQDIVAYWLAIAAGALADGLAIRRTIRARN